MSNTCVWHVSDLVRAFVDFMTVSTFLISSFLLFYNTLAFCSEKQFLDMGGELIKQEPKNRKVWKAKAHVLQILEKGNVTPYLEHLHGFKPHITEDFVKKWIDERVTLHGITVCLTKDFIAEVIGLPKEGIKFSKETSISNVAEVPED